jgi:hypothetical protein
VCVGFLDALCVGFACSKDHSGAPRSEAAKHSIRRSISENYAIAIQSTGT